MHAPHAVAIFVIDPGRTSGVTTAVIDMRQLTVQRCMRRARSKRLLETWHVKGSSEQQAWTLSKQVVDFFFYWRIERGLVEESNCKLVVEDFKLRQMDADLAPVEVTFGMQTLLRGPQETQGLLSIDGLYTKQSASEAKSFCSDEMLKKWRLFTKKSPHERDALRHLAKRIDRLLEGE